LCLARAAGCVVLGPPLAMAGSLPAVSALVECARGRRESDCPLRRERSDAAREGNEASVEADAEPARLQLALPELARISCSFCSAVMYPRGTLGSDAERSTSFWRSTRPPSALFA